MVMNTPARLNNDTPYHLPPMNQPTNPKLSLHLFIDTNNCYFFCIKSDEQIILKSPHYPSQSERDRAIKKALNDLHLETKDLLEEGYRYELCQNQNPAKSSPHQTGH